MASDLVTKIKSSGWVLEKSVGNGDTVYSKKLHRKIYKISVSSFFLVSNYCSNVKSVGFSFLGNDSSHTKQDYS